MAATITSFDTVLTRHSFQWTAYKTQTTLANPLSNTGSRTLDSTWTFGTTTGAVINQIVTGTVTLAGGATTDYAIDIGSSLANVVGTTSPTVTAIKEFWVELLAATQTDDASTAGTAASSITIGADGAAPWDSGPLGATDTYKINNGGKWIHQEATSTGMGVTTGDKFQILNNDGAVSAKIRFTFLAVA